MSDTPTPSASLLKASWLFLNRMRQATGRTITNTKNSLLQALDGVTKKSSNRWNTAALAGSLAVPVASIPILTATSIGNGIRKSLTGKGSFREWVTQPWKYVWNGYKKPVDVVKHTAKSATNLVLTGADLVTNILTWNKVKLLNTLRNKKPPPQPTPEPTT